MTRAEAEALAANHDLISLGVAADEARKRLHGDEVTFVRVLDVPVSGPMPAVPSDTGEVRIVELDPDAPEALERIREVVAGAGNVPVSACAAHELSGAVARRLHDAGLTLVAEAAVDRLQGPDAVRAVRDAGLEVARWVVHSYDPLSPLDLFDRLQEFGAIRAFSPLPRAIDPALPTTGYEDVKVVAVARLYLEQVPTISVDWSLYGPKLAQVALTFGADDLDGVPADTPDRNLLGPRRAPLEEVKRNIRAASFRPVQRNSRFDVIAR